MADTPPGEVDPSTFLAGTFYGNGTIPVGQEITARACAMDRLFDFFASITFSRQMDQQAPELFKFPRRNMHTEQPPAVVEARDLPALGVIPAEGTRDCSMPDFDDDSFDKYGPNTALVDLGWYSEEFQIEGWASSKVERRAIRAGLEQIFFSLSEATMLRLTLPNYFDQIATFDLLGSSDIDDDMVTQNRRRFMLRINMTVPVVMLVDLGAQTKALIDLKVVDSQAAALAQIKAEIEAKRGA